MVCRIKPKKQPTNGCGRSFQAKKRAINTPNSLLPTVKPSSQSCAKPRRVCRITSSQSRTDCFFRFLPPEESRFILTCGCVTVQENLPVTRLQLPRTSSHSDPRGLDALRKASRSALQYQTSGATTARFNSAWCSRLHLGASRIALIRFTLEVTRTCKKQQKYP